MDWAFIEPSIFGTLFERGLDPEKRSQLGIHYTGKDDITLIVEPVLMAPLRKRWAALKQQVQSLADERDLIRKNESEEINAVIYRELEKFSKELASIIILDPACGSGNFLYVALRLLLDLQKEVSVLGEHLGVGRLPITVSPLQLHGIEINAYAHELAQLTIWIGYIQWRVDNGYGLPDEPILQPIESILQIDAIMGHDEHGKPIEPEWPQADVIVGNPPFLGHQKMRSELGDKYVSDLRNLYEGRLQGASDLVCFWFEKARAMIEGGKSKRAGLLATQGIRGGVNRKVLERVKASGDIFWAYSDREWILEGATVHVSMIGFDAGHQFKKFLDGKHVNNINSNLTYSTDLGQAKTLEENKDLVNKGIMKGGPFDIDFETAQKMLNAPINPNGRPNSDVVKPRLGAKDIVKRNSNFWIIDFGVGTSKEDAALYELPFEYVVKHVKPVKEKNRRETRASSWWLFGENNPKLRNAIKDLPRCIVTPETSKHRIFVWMSTKVIPDYGIHVIARADDYFFGVLHSKIHELWARRKGTQLREAESGFRYTSTTTFETFPFPWPPAKEPKDDPRVQAIAQAAKELVERRDRWLNADGLSDADKKKRTLTNLYNEPPTWLELAHKKIDDAVFAAYGWKSDMSDEEILAKLLELNLERSRSKKQ